MNTIKLFALLLFVGSVAAHPQGLLDRFLYKRLENATVGTPAFPVIKILKPGENELIDKLPEYKLAKIPMPFGHHCHLTAAGIAKVAASLVALRCNMIEALVKNHKTSGASRLPRAQVRKAVLAATGHDIFKDYVVDTVQDVITDRLPESITERKVHPALKWVAAKAGNAALGFAYDRTAGAAIKAGLIRFAGIKI
jgi:hypothetical protein